MKTPITLASLLACALSVNAQITATLRTFPYRSPEIQIRNNLAVGLAAFAVTMAPVAQDGANPAPFVLYVDTIVDQTAMPLLPDQEYPFPVPATFQRGRPEGLFGPPIVTAGFFADGTSTGDPSLLARLILRRCNMLQAVELAREMLSDAGRHNIPRDQLIGQFKKIVDSLDHWYLPPEQRVGRVLYQSIVEKLMNLPELRLGSPFPPATFVEQETAMLTRRRTALLESRPSLADAAVIRR